MSRTGHGWLGLAGLVVGLVVAVTPALAADAGRVDLLVRAAPITVALDLSRTSIAAGKVVTVTASVANAGSLRLGTVTVTLRVDVTGLVVSKGATRTIGPIKGGKTATAQWSLCGTAPGAYLIFARATVEGIDVDSPAKLLVVTGTRNAKC